MPCEERPTCRNYYLLYFRMDVTTSNFSTVRSFIECELLPKVQISHQGQIHQL